ncbi:MAG: chloride channel protein [Bacteroidota bacterium]|jgi:CIC family chloride channel protein|nr:chloride channel protein [Bacteroidota bacterium]
MKFRGVGIHYVEKVLNWLHGRLSEKQFLLLSSALVGISAGLAAVILKSFVFFIRHYVVEQNIFTTGFKYLYLLLPILGIAITVFIIRRFFTSIQRGASAILFAIAKKASFLPFSQMYSHLVTSAVTVGFGGSAGLESPIVSTGSAIGSNYAGTYKLNYKDRTLLLACGAAGGIAGAFNAPVAGLLFALEVLLVGVNLTAFIPLLIASASGALTSKIILSEGILLKFSLKQPFDYYNVPYYILLGVLAGFLSLYYVTFFDKTEFVLSKRIKKPLNRLIVGGVLLGFLIAMFPSLFGEGYESIMDLSNNNIALLFKDSVFENYINNKWKVFFFITGTMLLKSVATGLTLGSGGNGGNFAPTLFVGAYLGFAFSFLLKLFGCENIPVTNFTIVAMSGVLAGVFHAPLTGIFLIAEITGGYELMIPLMIVSACSYALVKSFHPDSLDVKRLKKMGAYISEDKDKSILGKIEVEGMIEKNFTTVELDSKLRSIVETIKHSPRNVFPVVNKHGRLLGIIQLDYIREEMFNQDLYDKVIAKELMRKTGTQIELKKDDIFSIMKKFDESGQWNLPVVDEESYVGFLSKSTILTKYRSELRESY